MLHSVSNQYVFPLVVRKKDYVYPGLSFAEWPVNPDGIFKDTPMYFYPSFHIIKHPFGFRLASLFL